MKFCPNCGAQLNGQNKFCSECGFKLNFEPVAPPPPAPPVQAYEPPVAPPPAPSVQEPVAPPPPAPPVQAYEPPVAPPPAPSVQEPVAPPPPAPPVQPYAPPAQPYAPPAQPYAPQPAAKPAAKSRLPLFIGIGVAVVAVILAIIFIPKLFGGDANLGKYQCVSMKMMGFEITGSDLAEMGECWIELKSEGECTLMLMDEKVTGTWELDDEKITCELDGETCKGKLKDGRLELTVEAEGVELEIVFEKKASAKGEKETEAPPTPVGRYDIESMTVMEQTLEGDVLAQMGETWLEIRDDGSCTLMLMGEKVTGTYTLDDGDITCTLEGVECTGTWDEGSVELIMAEEGTELVMVFAKTDSLPIGGTETAGGYDWWEGDWYGWWIVTDATDEYDYLIDSYWDACATIEVDGTTGTIAVWDENYQCSEPLALVEGEFDEGFGDYGCFESDSGTFMDSEVGYWDWVVDSDAADAGYIDNMVCISGTYTDDDGESFDYYIFLRPWGMEWDDLEGKEIPTAPYDDMMPGGYYSWYLPLLEKGVTKAPDQVG